VTVNFTCGDLCNPHHTYRWTPNGPLINGSVYDTITHDIYDEALYMVHNHLLNHSKMILVVTMLTGSDNQDHLAVIEQVVEDHV
jgi:hypothetical protein